MALLYNLIEKKNPLKPMDPKKIYVVLKGLGLIKEEEISKAVSKELNIHEDMCKAVVNAWFDKAVNYLTIGHSVELGKAGYIYLRASSLGAITEEAATADLVKRIKGRIHFSNELQETFNSTQLINVGKLTSGLNLKEIPENP